MTDDRAESCLDLVRKQRSHVLITLSNAQPGQESAFRSWYQGAYRRAVLQNAGVLTAQHYEKHEFDISFGAYPSLPYDYLGIYELAIDGAEAAEVVIDNIVELHRGNTAATNPATWLYYPLGERVGRPPASLPSMMTLVFANAMDGKEAEFREWYTTRHIRDALKITPFVSGQCFERTQFQKVGDMTADFSVIAMYEQVASPQAVVDCVSTLPSDALRFPSLHPTRFIKWVYQPLPSSEVDEGDML
jgi:hypothetical protein